MTTFTDIAPYWLHSPGTLVNTARTLLTSGQRRAMVLYTAQAIEIKTVYWLIGVVNVADANTTLRIETVNSAGEPTGTLYGTNTNGTANVAAAGIRTFTLTSAASITAGSWFAVVIECVDAGGQIRPDYLTTIRSRSPAHGQGSRSMLYGGSWGTKAVGGLAGGFTDGSGNVVNYQDAQYIEAASTTAGTLRTAQVGAKFSFPTPIRVCGIAVNTTTQINNNTGDLTISLYDGATGPAGTPLETATIPVSTLNSTAGSRAIFFPSRELMAGETYRVACNFADVPGTGDQRSNGVDVSTNTVFRGDTYRGFPTCIETYDNAGAWADNASLEVEVSFLVDGVPASSGSSVIVIED